MALDTIFFKSFGDKFKKKKSQYGNPSEKVLALYKDKISAEFAEFMKEEGFCTYADGLFTSVDPFEYKVVMEEYGINTDMAIPLIKNAFGDIIYSDGYALMILHVSYNEKYSFGAADPDGVKYFYVIRLAASDFHTKFFKKSLFNKAMKEYGALAPDESYGFVPAIPLGGAEKLEQIEKVKTLEYLSILAQSF